MIPYRDKVYSMQNNYGTKTTVSPRQIHRGFPRDSGVVLKCLLPCNYTLLQKMSNMQQYLKMLSGNHSIGLFNLESHQPCRRFHTWMMIIKRNYVNMW